MLAHNLSENQEEVSFLSLAVHRGTQGCEREPIRTPSALGSWVP